MKNIHNTHDDMGDRDYFNDDIPASDPFDQNRGKERSDWDKDPSGSGNRPNSTDDDNSNRWDSSDQRRSNQNPDD